VTIRYATAEYIFKPNVKQHFKSSSGTVCRLTYDNLTCPIVAEP